MTAPQGVSNGNAGVSNSSAGGGFEWQLRCYSKPLRQGPTGTRYPTRTRNIFQYPIRTRLIFKIIGYFGYRVLEKTRFLTWTHVRLFEYWPFSHHFSIDFDIANIHYTVGMYFLIFTGNRDDIEWHDIPAPLGVYWEIPPKGQYFLIHSLGRISGTYPRLENIDNAPSMIQICTM